MTSVFYSHNALPISFQKQQARKIAELFLFSLTIFENITLVFRWCQFLFPYCTFLRGFNFVFSTLFLFPWYSMGQHISFSREKYLARFVDEWKGGEAYLACTLRMKQGWLFCGLKKNWTGRGKAVFATVCTNFSQKYLFRLFCRLFFLSFFLEKMHLNWFVRRFSFTCPMQHREGGRKNVSRHFCSRFPSFQYFQI